MRGLVLGLTPEQVVARAKYLGSSSCVDGFYLLHEHNGGKDPTAADPFDRWVKPGSLEGFQNRTADCIGGAAWCGGWDRYQPERFGYLYDGWINTDSMIEDALGKAQCFELLERPEPGAYVGAPTGARGFEGCGHIGTVISVPPEWDVDTLDCWRHVLIVDVASRSPQRANQVSNAGAWFGARYRHDVSRHAIFCRSIMTP